MKCAGSSHSSPRPSGRRPPASGTPITRPSVLPALVKCGAKRSQIVEITSRAWVDVSQRSSEAMMSGSACEATRYESFCGVNQFDRLM